VLQGFDSGEAQGFGPGSLIPSPFDPRLILRIAPAVARAAMESGVATRPIKNFDEYTALLETEGIKLVLSDDALEEVARFAARVNESSENIGARRLHTIMEKMLEDISFAGPDLKKKTVKVDAAYVRKQLADIVKDQDLSRYIL